MARPPVCDIDTLIEGERIGAMQISVAAWLCGLMAFEGYDMQALSFVAPVLLKQWHVSRAFGTVLSAHLFGFFFGAFALGFLSDKTGRKNIILAGTALFGLFTIAAGFAANAAELMALRFAAGFGLGGAVPIGIALAAEYMPKRVRATVIGLMYVAYTLGSSVGGFLAAYMVSDARFGWAFVFFFGGGASLLFLIGLAIALPESLRFLTLRDSFDPRIRVIAQKIRPERDLSLYPHFAVYEEQTRTSLISLFENGRAAITALLWCAFIVSLMGQYFIVAWMPAMLADAGVSLGDAAKAGGLLQIGGALGSLVIAVLLDRRGIKAVALTFLLTAPVVAALGAFAGFSAMLIFVIIIAGFGVFGGQIGLNAIAGTIYPTAMRSMGAGWALGIGRVGAITAPIIGGVLLGLGFSRPVLFLIAAVPFVLCAIFLVTLNAAKTARDLSGIDAVEPQNPGGAQLVRHA